MKLDALFNRTASPRAALPETEKSESIVVDARNFLVTMGRLDAGEPLPPQLEEALRTHKVSPRRLEDSIRSLENPRRNNHDDIEFALTYGIRNLSGAALETYLFESRDLDGYTFDNANLHLTGFKQCDLGNASFRNSELGGTYFPQSILTRVKFEDITIADRPCDLTANEITLAPDDIWKIDRTPRHKVGTCSSCEFINEGVLDVAQNDSSYHRPRNGVLLFQQGRPLGYMKLEGENSFLALRTVRNESGEALFWKGMLYGLETTVEARLTNMSWNTPRGKDMWFRADVESLRDGTISSNEQLTGLTRDNRRFLLDRTGKTYDTMSALVESIESGSEPIVDLVSGKSL